MVRRFTRLRVRSQLLAALRLALGLLAVALARDPAADVGLAPIAAAPSMMPPSQPNGTLRLPESATPYAASDRSST